MMKKAKYAIFLILALPGFLFAQNQISGRVIDREENTPLTGVTVGIDNSLIKTQTNEHGDFILDVLNISNKDSLLIEFIGYQSLKVPINTDFPLVISLLKHSTLLNEVIVSTGYYDIPKERATGSFTFIDNELLNRSISTDIISRLEGVTNSLLFDRRNIGGGSIFGEDYKELRIRGISSINSNNDPLIIVDNMPYESDINSINPNDVENITILKDAAAASIWGARAGNGVIVINLKKGKYNHPVNVSFNTNLTVSDRPDLFYDPNFIDSENFIEIEKELFSRGFYSAKESNRSLPVLSPVVETLIQLRDREITEVQAEERFNTLRSIDVRNDMSKYLYQRAIKRQYALSLQGGGDKVSYFLSGGYDKNTESLIANESDRITLNQSTSFRPLRKIEIISSLQFTSDHIRTNARTARISQFPYNMLKNENGEPSAIPYDYRLPFVEQVIDNGLLDWEYKPLEEREKRDLTYNGLMLNINTGLNYDIKEGLTLGLKHQFRRSNKFSNNLREKDSYYVRDLVNTFTQSDGLQVFPNGAVMSKDVSVEYEQGFRGQLNYNRHLLDHEIFALGGFEIRESHLKRQGWFHYYGYDPDVLTFQTILDFENRYPKRPNGTSRLPNPYSEMGEDYLDRYLSYYGNFSYSFKNKYIWTGSARWDGSNLFGVKTNQKGVPLWSTGLSWNISNENWFQSSLIEYLKIRATYGFNGNVNKNSGSFPVATYSNDSTTGIRSAIVSSPGNPELRWEKVRTINIGLDFSTKKSRISGSVEYYNKRSTDLLGEEILDATSGFIAQHGRSNLVNYASFGTNGIDLELYSNIGTGSFKWSSAILFNYSTNKVINYNIESVSINSAYGYTLFPVVGRSTDALYSIPWHGLDVNNGDPIVFINDEKSSNYTAYFRDLEINDLDYNGVSVAPFFGALRNTFTWRQLSLSFNVTWKAGYKFRRSSINYSNLFNSNAGHSDYFKRWQVPGDEAFTNTPSMPENADNNRDIIYLYSSSLIEGGSHIRLNDARLNWQLSNLVSNLFKNADLYCYASNLGILWRANKRGLDPDVPQATVLAPTRVSMGINIKF